MKDEESWMRMTYRPTVLYMFNTWEAGHGQEQRSCLCPLCAFLVILKVFPIYAGCLLYVAFQNVPDKLGLRHLSFALRILYYGPMLLQYVQNVV